jgi:hypothetical protein
VRRCFNCKKVLKGSERRPFISVMNAARNLDAYSNEQLANVAASESLWADWAEQAGRTADMERHLALAAQGWNELARRERLITDKTAAWR